MFRSVSSSDWEIFVLSAETQAEGGGGDAGGMTATRWDLLSVRADDQQPEPKTFA